MLRTGLAGRATAWCIVAMLATAAPLAAQQTGASTERPLPRFVSMKTDQGFARRGPARNHRVDWVFTRLDMPLKVVAEYGHWRRVEDRDGAGGWMHYSLLSGVRTVIVEGEMVPLRSQPRPDATPVAFAEAGVIARLGRCAPDWCRIAVGRTRGWVMKTEVWGVDPEETRD